MSNMPMPRWGKNTQVRIRPADQYCAALEVHATNGEWNQVMRCQPHFLAEALTEVLNELAIAVGRAAVLA